MKVKSFDTHKKLSASYTLSESQRTLINEQASHRHEQQE